MSESISFIDRYKAKKNVEFFLSSSWETTILNIVGTYGSGKTRFLKYIKFQIENDLWKLIGQDIDNKPQVIIISGKSFEKEKSRFIDFFYDNLSLFIEMKDASSLNEDGISIYTYMRKRLLEVSLSEKPMVIIFDDFAHVMKHMDETEVLSLNSLLVPGVHYILTTDHRNLKDIDPEKYSSSPFFHTARVINLFPISPENSRKMIEAVNKTEEDGLLATHKSGSTDNFRLGKQVIDLIIQLAGGHAGLLVALTKLSFFQIFSPILSGEEIIEFDELQKSKFLRYRVLEDGSVKDYLYNIMKTLETVSSDVINIILGIAISDRENDKSTDLPSIAGELRLKLIIMNILNEDFHTEFDSIPGELIRFSILQNFMNKPFSGLEDELLKLLSLYSPDLVSFDLIKKKLSHHVDDIPNEKDQKRLIDSTISRLRKKIDTSINPEAFNIENVRGEGFYLTSDVKFDKFLEFGSSVFLSGQGESVQKN